MRKKLLFALITSLVLALSMSFTMKAEGTVLWDAEISASVTSAEEIAVREYVAIENARRNLSQVVAGIKGVETSQNIMDDVESGEVVVTYLFEDGSTLTNEVHFENGNVVYASVGRVSIPDITMENDVSDRYIELNPDVPVTQNSIPSASFETFHEVWTHGVPLPPAGDYRVRATLGGVVYWYAGRIPLVNHILLTSTPIVYRLTYQGWLFLVT